MNQRVIFLTGANGGLGRAMVRGFLDERPENVVWLAVHHHREHADALAAEYPERCRCVPLDVTSLAAWRQAIDSVLSVHNRIDVLVNNAGMHEDALLGTMQQSAWERVMSTNLDSVFHGCKAVLPSMISQRSGRIVNISSLSALLAPAGQTNYAAAKAGVVALTQSLAKEVARIGITVNAVCPGYIDTEALGNIDSAARQEIRSRIPMRRLGRPEEVAAAVCFLACESASYITGCVLKIDGGIL